MSPCQLYGNHEDNSLKPLKFLLSRAYGCKPLVLHNSLFLGEADRWNSYFYFNGSDGISMYFCLNLITGKYYCLG